MNDKTRCPQCNGSKIILGAGYIEHKCDACDGKGYITLNDKTGNVAVIDEPIVKPLEVKPSVEITTKSVEVTTKLDKRSKAYRQSIGRK